AGSPPPPRAGPPYRRYPRRTRVRHAPARAAPPRARCAQVPGYRRSSSPNLQRAECDQAAQDPEDPEAHDDLALGPPELLEVVMQRRHLEEPLAATTCAGRVLEPAHLRHDAERLHHEHAADDHEQELTLDQDCDRA